DEPGVRVALRTQLEATAHFHLGGARAKNGRARVRVHDHDVHRPVGIGLTEGADADRPRAQDEEGRLGLERRGQEPAHHHGPTGESSGGLGELETKRTGSLVEIEEAERFGASGGGRERQERRRDQPGCGARGSAHRPASAPKPSASAMMRNTSVLSRKPRTRSAPGPVAVSTTSSPVCTPWGAFRGRFPVRRIAPGTSLYFSLATYVLSGPATAGTNGPSSLGRKVS